MPSRQGTSVPTITGRSAAGTASSSRSIRLSRLRNSKRRNISRSSERSGGASTSSDGSKSRSRSRRIVASSFDSRATSANSVMFFRRAGESSSACSITSSSEPYWAISWPAVLSPMPGTPGMLSGGVALEADEVRDLLGRDAVAGLDALGRVDLRILHAARRHHQADVLRHELERVAVGRDDAGLDPRLVGARRERRDHVVRLPALELEVAVAERLDDRAEVGNCSRRRSAISRRPSL